jgi:hypothetical protein
MSSNMKNTTPPLEDTACGAVRSGEAKYRFQRETLDLTT